MKEISFIHAADLHLDSPFKGLNHLPDWLLDALKESSFQSLKKLIAAAIEHRVNFIIFAGDLFDQQFRSLRAQLRLKSELETLKQYGIDVYISFGNHDHLGGEWAELSWGDHIHFFPKEVTRLTYCRDDEITVHLYGFSYEKRAETTRMIRFYEKEGDADFHIGVLHGQVEGDRVHATYAPFSVAELLEKEFDYWALGHIHKRTELAEHIVYPGNIQGRHRKETGEKGCMLVTLKKHEVRKTFIETSPIIWDEAQLDVTTCATIDELMSACEQLKERLRKEEVGRMLVVTLIGQTPLHKTLSDRNELAAVIDELNEAERGSDFVWIASLERKTNAEIDYKKLASSEHFLADVLATAEQLEDEQKELLKSLFSHRQGRKFFTHFSDEEWKMIIERAKEFVFSELLKELKE